MCAFGNLSEIAYILSFCFQLSGAILLIIKYWGKTKERIIEEYFPGSNFIKREEDGMCYLEKEKVQKCARTVYDNRMSFLFIAIGYILSIFGNKPNMCEIYITMRVVVGTVVIILLEKGISIWISKKIYKKGIEKPYKELSYIADTSISKKEIEDLF